MINNQPQLTLKKIKVALMGCTGLVGQQFVRMLDGHPYFDLVTLTSSSRSAGKRYGQAVSWTAGNSLPEFVRDTEIKESTAEAVAADGARVVFSALPSSVARGVEPELRRRGLFLFSNASSRRLDEDVPVLIPEVNPDHLGLARQQMTNGGGAIIANSNCSTSGLVIVLKALWGFGLRTATVTTFQAISGAGRRGLSAMDIAANVIPFIREEEEKMAGETQKILGRRENGRIAADPIRVNASCCRVPVRDGHLLSLSLDVSQAVKAEDILAALSEFRALPQDLALPSAPERPLIVRFEEDRPQPVLDSLAGQPERARGMAVSVGRVRTRGRAVNCFALVHNTIRGAAGTCLESAELAFVRNFFNEREPGKEVQP